MGEDDQDSVVNSRTFALALIGIASLYVFIMIYKAYQENKRRLQDEGFMGLEYTTTYIYETESYDFRPYQSANSADEGRGIVRGFKYNESIHMDSSSNHQ